MERRLIRMRFDILKAMDRLCRDVAYDDIPVETLCDEVGISRATFYRSFESKYRIASWWQDLVLLATMRRIGRVYSWQDGLLASYSTWNLLPDMNRAARQCRGFESCSYNYRRKSKACLLDTIVNYRHASVDEDLLFQVDYFTGADALKGARWSSGRRGNDPQTMVRRLTRCIPRDLFDLLDVPAESPASPSLTMSDLMRVAQGDGEEIFTEGFFESELFS